MIQPTEDCARCNPFVAMVCDEEGEGTFGRPCLHENPQAGEGVGNGDNSGMERPSHQGRGNLAGVDEAPPAPVISLGQSTRPHPIQPRHDWHDCPSPFPACGVSREDALTPMQRAECRECHQGFGHD